MTLREKVNYERERVRAWSLIEEGFLALAALYREGTCDRRHYEDSSRHPSACRKMAEVELDIVERALARVEEEREEKP